VLAKADAGETAELATPADAALFLTPKIAPDNILCTSKRLILLDLAEQETN